MSGPADNEGGLAPVLVAAGDQEVRRRIAARLEAIGPIVAAATSADAVAAMAKGARVAIVVPPLPGSVGAEVLDDLRACVPGCPVVAVVDDLGSELAVACARREHVVLLATTAMESEVLLVAVRAARSSADSSAARLERARTVFQHLREAVLVHSPSGRIVLANPAAEALLGRQDAGGRALPVQARDGSAIAPGADPVARALAERRPVGPVIVNVVRPDGSNRLVDCVAHPLLRPGGGSEGVVSLWRDVTDDEARRDALLAAERLQVALLDHGYEAHLVIDAAGCVAAAQGSAAGLFTPRALIGRPIEEIFHPADRSALTAVLAAATPEHGVSRGELRVLDESGAVRHVEVAAASHREDPAVAGIVLSLHDVTRRRALADAVARLAALVEESPEAIVSEEEHGRIALWNPAAESLYGTAGEEAVGELATALVPWRARPDVNAIVQALATGEMRRAEQRVEMVARDGSRVAIDLTALPLRRPDGRPGGINWLARRAAAAGGSASARAAHPARLGFEHGAVGMAIADADERIIDANPALCRFLGRSSAEMQGRRLTEFLHPADGGPSESLAPLVVGDRRHERDERRYVRPDGAVVWGHAEVLRVDDPEGGRPSYFTQLQDVTERRLAEEALAHQARHDPLTDLPNGVLLADRLGQALKRANRNGLWVALIAVDIDRFGELNDQLGRSAGDQIIVETGARLAGGVRASDTVAHVGGDDFVVVCEEVADDTGARKLAETITALFAEPVQVDERAVAITVSCGVVLLGPHVSVGDALEYGDAALNMSRSQGGNQATVVDRTAPGANLKVVH